MNMKKSFKNMILKILLILSIKRLYVSPVG